MELKNSKLTPSDMPWVFNLELTNRCPFSCVMCARTNNMKRSEGDMSIESYITIIDQLVGFYPQHYYSRLLRLHHFGESLVHPDVIEMINYAKSKGLKPALSINPLLLKENLAKELVNSGIHTLFISLDGHDNESFEKIRGVSDAYEKSVQRLLSFLELKESNNASIHIELSMINFAFNRESIDIREKYWSEIKGIDVFRNKKMITWDGEAEDVNALQDDKTVETINEFVTTSGSCKQPFDRVTILFDGRVVPCCYDYDGKYILGNLNENGLQDIWNGEPMKELRAEFISGNITNPLCRSCSQRPRSSS